MATDVQIGEWLDKGIGPMSIYRHSKARRLIGAGLLGVGLCSVSLTQAQESTPAEKQDEEVFKTELVYKADFLSIDPADGKKKSVYLGNIDAKLTVDGARAFQWPGSTFFIYVLNNNGGRPNGVVRTAQGVDNIEVETATTKLYQAWYQQQFFGERASALLGLYDLNSEFYVNDASAPFIHPAFGIGSEFAQTGVNGPSIFPVTSFGARFRLDITPQIYWLWAVLDGVPGDPDKPHGTHVEFGKDDGWLLATELGIKSDDGKLGLGIWHYTERFDDLIDTDAAGNPVRRLNQGFYLIAERQLTRAAEDSARGLRAFVRLGVASPDINQFENAVQIGVTYQGLFPGRGDDIVGFGIARERNGDKFRQVALAAGEAAPTYEDAYEFTYRAKLANWLVIQPDVQYVRNHGDPVVMRATIVGVRCELSW